MRDHYKKAATPLELDRIERAFIEFGAYAGLHKIYGYGYDCPPEDVPAPVHARIAALQSETPGKAAQCRADHLAAWEQERKAIEFSKTRRSWAATTSKADDTKQAEKTREAQAADERERWILARASQLRAEAEAKVLAKFRGQAERECPL